MPADRDTLALTIERFETIDSTSLQARRLVAAGDEGASAPPRVIVARTQTAGVGQRGRAWNSPPGGLWCTFIVPWREPLCRGSLSGAIATLGVRIGLACVRTIEDVIGRDPAPDATPRLKLPNDVLIGGRKVLGVLTEIVTGATGGAGLPVRHLLVGVGINANVDVADLSPDVAHTATTLRCVIGRETDLELLLDRLARRLLASLDVRLLDAAEIQEVGVRLAGRGTTVGVRTAGGEVIEGALEGVDDAGQVVVRLGGAAYAGALISRG